MEFFDDIFAGWSFEPSENIDRYNFVDFIRPIYESEILKFKTISLSDRKEAFITLDKTAELFVEAYEKNKHLSIIGETLLDTNEGPRMFEEAVVISYEPYIPLISIDTYTDAWMPIGYLDEILQIDSSILNSNRLKGVLEQISQLSFIKDIDPAEEEYFHDYMAHQIGFGLFYKQSIENIKGLAQEDYHKVAPFILPNNVDL